MSDLSHIELVVRGDDSGNPSANRAIVECYQNGPLRNTSVMAMGTALAQAADMFSQCPELSIGLHVVLNSEWTFPRYQPVLPASQVPSLVGPDGCFLPSPADLKTRGIHLDEAMAEISAQYDRLCSCGLKPGYVDEHMGVGWLPGLRDRIADFAAKKGLVVAAANADQLPDLKEEKHSSLCDDWVRRISAAKPGRYVLIVHPLSDDEEANAITRQTDPPGKIARERNADRRQIQDAEWLRFLKEHHVRIVRYIDPLPA